MRGVSYSARAGEARAAAAATVALQGRGGAGAGPGGEPGRRARAAPRTWAGRDGGAAAGAQRSAAGSGSAGELQGAQSPPGGRRLRLLLVLLLRLRLLPARRPAGQPDRLQGPRPPAAQQALARSLGAGAARTDGHVHLALGLLDRDADGAAGGRRRRVGQGRKCEGACMALRAGRGRALGACDGSVGAAGQRPGAALRARGLERWRRGDGGRLTVRRAGGGAAALVDRPGCPPLLLLWAPGAGAAASAPLPQLPSCLRWMGWRAPGLLPESRALPCSASAGPALVPPAARPRASCSLPPSQPGRRSGPGLRPSVATGGPTG
jgi:hypothetical protein